MVSFSSVAVIAVVALVASLGIASTDSGSPLRRVPLFLAALLIEMGVVAPRSRRPARSL
jgi:hypothetical protein